MMQFRHLKAADLDGSAELPGLGDWLNTLTPEQCSFLLVAPAGSGKSAAIGSVARRTGKSVVMCNLLQVLEYPDSDRQLRNLLLACETQRDTVLYLDKVDELIDTWNKAHPDEASRVSGLLQEWLQNSRARMKDEGTVVVCTGRNVSLVPPELQSKFDRVLTA